MPWIPRGAKPFKLTPPVIVLLLVLVLEIRGKQTEHEQEHEHDYERKYYREISAWLRSWKPSPRRTDEAQSVSSTWRARAANPRG
jgi:hypothetical protein